MDGLDVVELFFAVLLIAMMGTLWWLAKFERAAAERKRAAAQHIVDGPAIR